MIDFNGVWSLSLSLCSKMINLSVADTIDERTINKKKLTPFTIQVTHTHTQTHTHTHTHTNTTPQTHNTHTHAHTHTHQHTHTDTHTHTPTHSHSHTPTHTHPHTLTHTHTHRRAREINTHTSTVFISHGTSIYETAHSKKQLKGLIFSGMKRKTLLKSRVISVIWILSHITSLQ